jgi:hypothetical protein
MLWLANNRSAQGILTLLIWDKEPDKKDCVTSPMGQWMHTKITKDMVGKWVVASVDRHGSVIYLDQLTEKDIDG